MTETTTVPVEWFTTLRGLAEDIEKSYTKNDVMPNDLQSLLRHIFSGGWYTESSVKSDEAINQALTAERERLINEIIENIPICRDRIQKCSCYDHYGNDAVFEYLNDLINPPSNLT